MDITQIMRLFQDPHTIPRMLSMFGTEAGTAPPSDKPPGWKSPIVVAPPEHPGDKPPGSVTPPLDVGPPPAGLLANATAMPSQHIDPALRAFLAKYGVFMPGTSNIDTGKNIFDMGGTQFNPGKARQPGIFR